MFLVLAQITTQHLWIKLLNTWGRYPLVAFFKTTFVFLLPLIQSILLTLCHSDNSKKSSFWKGFFHQNTFLQKSVNCWWDVWLNSYLCVYYTSPIAYFMCQWTFGNWSDVLYSEILKRERRQCFLRQFLPVSAW